MHQVEGGSVTEGAQVPASAMRSGSEGVRVRMYRQGLGDCFLLTLQGSLVRSTC